MMCDQIYAYSSACFGVTITIMTDIVNGICETPGAFRKNRSGFLPREEIP